ncbi:hypothetical protein A3Q56_08539, partial [Intoshia linei]
ASKSLYALPSELIASSAISVIFSLIIKSNRISQLQIVTVVTIITRKLYIMTYTARYVDKNREAIYAIQDLFYSYFVILSGSGALTDCPSAKLIFYQIEISDKGTYNFVKKNEYQIPGDPIDIDFFSSQQLPNITQYSNFDIVNQNVDKFYIFIVYNTEIKRLEISFDIDFEVPI